MSDERQVDHDILIEIRTIVRANQDSFTKHCEEDAMRFGDMNKTLIALHRRVDGFTLSGVLAIIVVVMAWLIKR